MPALLLVEGKGLRAAEGALKGESSGRGAAALPMPTALKRTLAELRAEFDATPEGPGPSLEGRLYAGTEGWDRSGSTWYLRLDPGGALSRGTNLKHLDKADGWWQRGDRVLLTFAKGYSVWLLRAEGERLYGDCSNATMSWTVDFSLSEA